MDMELRRRLERLESQGDTLLECLAGMAEQLRVAVAQGGQIIRLMTAEPPRREGPGLEDLLAQAIRQLTAQSALPVGMRDTLREAAAAAARRAGGRDTRP